MSYYKDALYTLEHITEVPSIFIHETIKDLAEVFKELVDKEIELQSRKEKLVVGSEWECVVPCFADDSMYYKVGVKVKVLSFNEYDKASFVKVASEWQEVTFVKDQFLLCFKPKESTNG